MTSSPALFVAWQDPQGRSIIPVGRLERGETGFTFEYIRGALRARECGFLSFVEFPLLAARYTSESLFPLFQNRLMPTSRPDYVEHIAALGLEASSVEPMVVLARSGGGRATDRVELFAAPAFDPQHQRWESYFLLRGVRHRPAAAQARVLELKPHERLHVMLDLQNEHNQGALLLRSADGHNVGYLPDYMVEDASRLLHHPAQIEVSVQQVNPPPIPVHHRVLCRLVARWDADFMPFTGADYRSLVDDPAAERADVEAALLDSAAE